MRMQDFFVYILTSKNRTVLSIGIAKNLKRRLEKHRSKQVPGFSARYTLNQLI